MNWDKIFFEVLITFSKTAGILGAYYFSKKLTTDKIAFAESKITVGIKLYFISKAIFTVGIFCYFLNNVNSTKYAAYFLTLIIPSIIGITTAIEKDSKLTPNERSNLQSKIMQEKRDSDKYKDY